VDNNAVIVAEPADRRSRSPRQGAQAIRRALAVLRILAAGRERGLPLMEVVQATGLARPTVHRIVHVLIEEGIVERNGKTGRYAIGGQVSELALARRSRSRLLVTAEPWLAEVSTRIEDTVFLTTRTGLDTLCVARRIGSFPIQVLSIEVGARRPLGVSSAGVAILAALPPSDTARIVEANRARFAAYRADVATVLGQIADARRRGYGFRDVGLIKGTRSLSACIMDADERPLAAITVSAIRHRLGPRRQSEVAEIVMRAASKIRNDLDESV